MVRHSALVSTLGEKYLWDWGLGIVVFFLCFVKMLGGIVPHL